MVELITNKRSKFVKFLFVLLFAVASLSACKDDDQGNLPVIPPVLEKTDYKVLFVGNSYTHYNDGVDYHLEKMLKADVSADSVNYSIQRIAVSSHTLEAHYADPLTLTKIKSEKWNIIVLQEQSTRPINNPDLFLQFAGELDAEAKKINAKTALFMTWANKDAPSDMALIAVSYTNVGLQLNEPVTPAGKIWEYIQKTYPQISLYNTDNKHPTLSGTYTVACSFYYSLFKKNPVKNTYIPTGMLPENAVTIRKAVYEYLNQ